MVLVATGLKKLHNKRKKVNVKVKVVLKEQNMQELLKNKLGCLLSEL